jgi:hypothetical protein
MIFGVEINSTSYLYTANSLRLYLDALYTIVGVIAIVQYIIRTVH